MSAMRVCLADSADFEVYGGPLKEYFRDTDQVFLSTEALRSFLTLAIRGLHMRRLQENVNVRL